MEIERKFLPLDQSQVFSMIHNLKGTHFIQGYLCTNPVIRIRKEGDQFVLTYKGKGMMAREEYNLPLTESAFFHLLPKCDHHILSKTRYCYELDSEKKQIAEIDVFHGALDSLILIEVEFESEEAAKNFKLPDWFGREVTFDTTYHNSTLSKTIKLPDIL